MADASHPGRVRVVGSVYRLVWLVRGLCAACGVPSHSVIHADHHKSTEAEGAGLYDLLYSGRAVRPASGGASDYRSRPRHVSVRSLQRHQFSSVDRAADFQGEGNVLRAL